MPTRNHVIIGLAVLFAVVMLLMMALDLFTIWAAWRTRGTVFPSSDA